ncbi:MAG: FAD-dependent oxidoreductase [Oscillospiraceae bacterium]|nr:FAD-dependent oxidoreductase [Oscillospiraceae bacterium]
MKHYVIIGGSIAGMNCIEGIRSVDPDGPITLISAEPDSNYCRPLISYYLEGKTDRERMRYRAPDFFAANGCEVRSGVRAEKLLPDKKQVQLSDGGVVDYDALCVATGSSPFVPRFEGLETVDETKRFFFTQLTDALSLEQAVDSTTRVLVIGAGFIGLKCAEGLTGRVAEITVCDLADRAMSSILDADSAPILERRLRANGLNLLLGDSAVRFDGCTALMKSGKTLEFDILVLAIGTRPNTALLAEADAAVGRGVQINDRMETSLPDVWAAGDCVESVDVTTGEAGLLAILPNASLQGRCAGVNMAGGEAVFDKGIRMNSIGFYGMHIMTAGNYFTGEDGGAAYADITETRCKKLFTRDGYLTGFILVDDISHAGIYTALIRERTPLEQIDFDAVKKQPSLLPFGKTYRAQKLGGVV